jgi:tRNA A37 methylthiotransferase MiaB
MRPSLVQAIVETPGVVPYFDLSFQHASERVLRRMRRFGSREHFLALLSQIRAAAPTAGVRSNVIVGFPGETEHDLAELEAFLVEARLDAVGVFGYSPEDGTEAATFTDDVDADEVRSRVERVASLAEQLVSQRAEERIGDYVSVLVTEPGFGLAEHQAPEVDGVTALVAAPGHDAPQVADVVAAQVVATDGVDLIAHVLPTP